MSPDAASGSAPRFPVCGRDGAFTYLEVADGVIMAVARPRSRPDCNAVIVDLGGRLLVVDAHARPSSATAVAAFVSTEFGRPVDFLVDTHHHWDHWHGNAAWRSRHPGIEIFAHGRAIELMHGVGQAGLDRQRVAVTGDLARLRAEPGTDADDAAAVLDAEATELAGLRLYPATRAIDDELVLSGDRREVRIVHPGPAHTSADLLVELPAERTVATGDCVVAWTPFLGDADPTGWIRVLDALDAAPFDTLLVGHGPPAGRPWLAAFRTYLAALDRDVRAGIAAGLAGPDLVEAVRERLGPGHRDALDAVAGADRRWDDRMPANVARVEELVRSKRSAIVTPDGG